MCKDNADNLNDVSNKLMSQLSLVKRTTSIKSEFLKHVTTIKNKTTDVERLRFKNEAYYSHGNKRAKILRSSVLKANDTNHLDNLVNDLKTNASSVFNSPQKRIYLLEYEIIR